MTKQQPRWPSGDGEMAGLVRAHDWAATPLGPVRNWSRNLRAVVDLIFDSPLAMIVLWGPDLTQIYNDAYRVVMVGKHPAGLGQGTRECWPEAWAFNGPIYETVMKGDARSFTNQKLTVLRDGTPEEAFFDLTYAPLRNEPRGGKPDGKIMGVLVTVVEVTERVRFERSLRASEERFRAFVTATSDVVYHMAPDWSEMRQLDGRGFLADTAEPSRTWLDRYIHPDDQPGVLAAIEEAIRTRRTFELEHRVRRVDGSLGWTLSRAVPIQDEAGELTEWLGAASDITAREQAGAHLRESEERFRQFADASSDVLWVRDAETLGWEYLSPGFEPTYGLTCAEALSGDTMLNWAALIHPEDREHALQNIAHVRDGGRATFEFRITRPADGQTRWLRNTDFPMRDATGQVVRIGGIGQDVTEIKESEAAVAASEARLRSLVEGIPQLVWRAREEGSWVWSSPQWCSYTGLSEAESRDLGWLAALHPDDRGPIMEAWRNAGERVTLQADVRVLHAGDGRYRWFQSRAVPVHDSQGHIVEWLGTMTDIEDQVQSRDELERRVQVRTGELMAAEATLRQAQKMDAIGQLTGGIAHDFNNMLQAIAASLELMRRRTEQGRPAEAERYMESAQDTVRRAAALTHRLLAFARQQPLDPKPLTFDALVTSMADLIRHTVGPQVQIEVRLGDGTWPVLCDQSQLENALLNLCVNARDAMSGGGWLTISTEEAHLSAADLAGPEGMVEGNYAVLAVGDTGVGVDEATQARVFEPFYTTKPLGQGTGLGLPQVYGFVRQSGGFVQLDSAPGQGTTVRLYLPRHELADGVTATVATPSVVLLVEDEDNLRAMAADWLRESGLRVLEAPDGAAALRLLQSGGRIDMLVSDVGLPGGINGRQVAEAARAQHPALPVLLMTGYAGTVLSEAPLPPDVAVLNKPFALVELANHVQTMLETGM